LSLLFFLFFLLDQKETKNQESPKVASRQSLSATRPFVFETQPFVVMSGALGVNWFYEVSFFLGQ